MKNKVTFNGVEVKEFLIVSCCDEKGWTTHNQDHNKCARIPFDQVIAFQKIEGLRQPNGEKVILACLL